MMFIRFFTYLECIYFTLNTRLYRRENNRERNTRKSGRARRMKETKREQIKRKEEDQWRVTPIFVTSTKQGSAWDPMGQKNRPMG